MKVEHTRRHVLGGTCTCLAATAALGLINSPRAAHAKAEVSTKLGADEVLALLEAGNQDFLGDKPLPTTSSDHKRRLSIALSQSPMAVLVACSDSRVSPELLFGRGLGELFIIRNAGNTVDTTGMGSIEYAVSQLSVPLVVVMGHQRCGAVQAAVDVVSENARFSGSIGMMVEPIIPAVLEVRQAPGDLLDNAVRANVSRTVRRLRTASEPALLDPIKSKRLKVVGARYDLDTGRVDFFDRA